MNEITVTELARGLSEFINRATYRREEFLIVRGGKPVATLSPAPAGVRIGDLAQVLSNLPHLSDEELDGFESDVTEARNAQNQPVVDPWR